MKLVQVCLASFQLPPFKPSEYPTPLYHLSQNCQGSQQFQKHPFLYRLFEYGSRRKQDSWNIQRNKPLKAEFQTIQASNGGDVCRSLGLPKAPLVTPDS